MVQQSSEILLRLARSQIDKSGFAVVSAAEMRVLLGSLGSHDVQNLAETWNNLVLDHHMADGGRYRKRRHAVFQVRGRAIRRLADQPHYQETIYNVLNGGLERWFEPVAATVEQNPVLMRLFDLCAEVFVLDGSSAYRAVLHQFRIEAMEGNIGLPTPEGMHRDGVDYRVLPGSACFRA